MKKVILFFLVLCFAIPVFSSSKNKVIDIENFWEEAESYNGWVNSDVLLIVDAYDEHSGVKSVSTIDYLNGSKDFQILNESFSEANKYVEYIRRKIVNSVLVHKNKNLLDLLGRYTYKFIDEDVYKELSSKEEIHSILVPYIITASGCHHIGITVKDHVDNETVYYPQIVEGESEKQFLVIKIDKEIPVLEFKEPCIYVGGTELNKYSWDEWTNGDYVTYSISASDEYSGLASVYGLGDNKTYNIINNNFSNSFYVYKEGVTIIKPMATDNVGNVGDYGKYTIKIDRTAPKVTFGQRSEQGWKNSDITETIIISDAKKGIETSGIDPSSIKVFDFYNSEDKVQIKDGIVQKQLEDGSYEITVTLSKEGIHKLAVEVYDNAGNKTYIKNSFNLFNRNIEYKIDKTKIDRNDVKVIAVYEDSTTAYRKELNVSEEVFAGNIQKLVFYVEKDNVNKFKSAPLKIYISKDKGKTYEIFNIENREFVYDVSSFAEGDYNLNIKFEDEAGNISEIHDPKATSENIYEELKKDFNIDRKADSLSAEKLGANEVKKNDKKYIQIELYPADETKDTVMIKVYEDNSLFGKAGDKFTVYKDNKRIKYAEYEKKDSGIYKVFAEAVDMYGNHNHKEMYYVWRNEIDNPDLSDEAKVRNYEVTANGLKSYVEIPVTSVSYDFDGKTFNYQRTYYYKDVNGIEHSLSSDGNFIRIYIKELKEALVWSSDKALERTLKIYYKEKYPINDNEKEIINGKEGISKVSSFVVKDFVPVFNKNIIWPQYISGNEKQINFELTCKAEEGSFTSLVSDPDEDPILYKITLNSNNKVIRTLYSTSIPATIDIPDGKKISGELTITVEAKGIRTDIPEDEKEYENVWKKETSSSVKIEKTYSKETVDTKAPQIVSKEKDSWVNAPLWTTKTDYEFEITDDVTGLRKITVEYFKNEEEKDISQGETEVINVDGTKSYIYKADLKKFGDELNGKYKIRFSYTDKAGNSGDKIFQYVLIDTTKPKIDDVETKTDKNGDIVLNLKASDVNGSGVKDYCWKLKNSEVWEEWKPYIEGKTIYIPMSLKNVIDRNIQIKVRDKQLNESIIKAHNCGKYEKVMEIENISVSGINEKGYITKSSNFNVNVNFVNGVVPEGYLITWKLTDVETGVTNNYTKVSSLKKDLIDGRTYELSVEVVNSYGSRTTKKYLNELKVKTSSPEKIKIQTKTELIKGKQHEVIITGGIDSNCSFERTIYAVKKNQSGNEEVIYKKVIESEDSIEKVLISTSLLEEHIKTGKVYLYAESKNEAGLVSKSSVSGTLKLIEQQTGMYIEADEYSSGSLNIRWNTNNKDVSNYRYKIVTDSNKILEEAETENTILVYDLKDSLEDGALITVYVDALSVNGKVLESGASNQIIYSTEHPNGVWKKTPKAVVSNKVWAEYEIGKGLDIAEKSWAIEIFEYNEETKDWEWNGLAENNENLWNPLSVNKGKIEFDLSEVKKNGRIIDGSLIRIRLSVVNKAGLETFVDTGSIVIDDTNPPLPVVIDQGDVINPISQDFITVEWNTSLEDKESGSTYYWRWYLAGTPDFENEWKEAEWNSETKEQNLFASILDEGIRTDKYDGCYLFFQVKAVNGAGLESIGESNGILLDSNAPVIEDLYLYKAKAMLDKDHISGYTKTSSIGKSLYVSMKANDITSWINNAEVILSEVNEKGIFTELKKVSVKIKDSQITAEIPMNDIDVKAGKRYIVQAKAVDAAGNLSGIANGECIILIDSPSEIQALDLKADINQLNITWIPQTENEWTKEYQVKVSSTINSKELIFNVKGKGLSVQWKDIAEDIMKQNGKTVYVEVKPVSYNGETGTDKISAITLYLELPKFDEESQMIPSEKILNSWADFIKADISYLTQESGLTIEWSCLNAEDGSEITDWERRKNAKSLTVNKNIEELIKGITKDFWHNKKLILKFRAVNGMGLSSVEKIVKPVLIDITAPELADISRDWIWTNKPKDLDEIKIKGKDKDSGLVEYITALIPKEEIETYGIEKALSNNNVSKKEKKIDAGQLFELSNETISIVNTKEGMFKAVLGVRNGSGLWTYVESKDDIEVDRTPPLLIEEKSQFFNTIEQEILNKGAITKTYVTNGPLQNYKFTSNEESKWTIQGDEGKFDVLQTNNYEYELENVIDFKNNNDGVIYTVIIEMTDKAGNKGSVTKNLRYNKAPVVTVLYDKETDCNIGNNIIVWPGHTKSIKELVNVSDIEVDGAIKGDFPFTFTWNAGNGEESVTWTGGNSAEDVLGKGADFISTYYQKNKKAQISKYIGELKVTDCWGKESITPIEITVENTRNGELIVDEYWTGDYTITGEVVIPETRKLTLENANIKVNGPMNGLIFDSGFMVKGILEEKGTTTISSLYSSTKWKGINVIGNLSGNNLIITDADRGIVLHKVGKLKVNELSLQDCTNGIHLFGGDFSVTTLNLFRNKKYAIKEETDGNYEYGTVKAENNGKDLYRDGITSEINQGE